MKIIIDIPEVPKNDKQRWVLTNGTPYEKRPHGEWKADGTCSECCVYSSLNKDTTYFCPNCGADMRVKNELNRVNKELNNEIEKLKSEIENSDLPERFTATDCSCLNCKNRHSVHCEPQNKKIYGYCGNWERR